MSDEKPNVEELLKKAQRPTKLAMEYHPFYKGKVEVTPKVSIWDFQAFGVWYTPGVAAPCKVINKDLAKDPPDWTSAYEYTNKWNNVAVVSDGSRVLGLGNIGPEAGMPVMEGKALLFKYLGGVDAFPVCVNCHEPEEIIQVVKWIQPSFGGINLEDISQPKCFEVLDTLRADKEMTIPVWHDDAQGTASITVAGVVNALKVVGKKMDDVLITLVGAGAANITIARLLVATGVPAKNLIIVDSKGILHPGREDKEKLQREYKQKWHFAEVSNGEGRTGGKDVAIKGSDIIIGASKPGPGVITKEQVASMNDDSIIFACANPVPEIWPWEAKEAGARITGTGRSDFDNQINNSLGFPGIFRGTLDVHAYTITDEMVVAAVHAIAGTAEEKGLSETYIVPTMDEIDVFINEAVAVAVKAMDTGVARVKKSKQDLRDHATAIITRSRNMTSDLMKSGWIKAPPKVD
ncbi:MAG: NAD(P)-dependent malic enzyme [Candidatus Hodarchaeales archaeon]